MSIRLCLVCLLTPSYCDIVGLHGSQGLDSMLYVLRMSLFTRICRKANTYTLKILGAASLADSSWLRVVAQDLGAFGRYQGSQGQATHNIQQWMQYVRGHHMVFVKDISAYAKSCMFVARSSKKENLPQVVRDEDFEHMCSECPR